MFEIRADELLGADPACEPHPEAAALVLKPQRDIEERAAKMFASRPFRDQLHARPVGGKLELETVRKLTDALDHAAQLGTQFVEVAGPRLCGARQPIAGEGRFPGRQKKSKSQYKHQFHASMLKPQVDLKA